MTDPYLNLFRNLIPPLMGQIDFTPIFGFMVLQFLVQVLGAAKRETAAFFVFGSPFSGRCGLPAQGSRCVASVGCVRSVRCAMLMEYAQCRAGTDDIYSV